MAAAPGGTVRYGLGPRLLQLASRALRSQLDLRAALADDLQALRDETGETVHLSVPAGTEMIYIDKLESQGRCAWLRAWDGRLAPALHGCRQGAYLAALPEAEAEPLIAGLDLACPHAEHHHGSRCPAPRTGAHPPARLCRRRRGNERGIVCYSVAIAGKGGRPWPASASARCNSGQQGAAPSRYIAPLLRLRDAAHARFSAWPAMAGGAFSREDT